MRVSRLIFFVFGFLALLSSLSGAAEDSDDETIEDCIVEKESNATSIPVDQKEGDDSKTEDKKIKVDLNVTDGNKNKEKEQGLNRTSPVSEQENTSDDEEEDDIIEINPNFEEEEVSEEDEYDEYDSEDEEEDEVRQARPRKSSKTAIDTALSQSRKLPRRTIKFVKKNRMKITVAMVLFAFRREIGGLVLNKIAPPIGTDPKTGKVVRKLDLPRLSPTSIVKIIVFIDIMRQLQAAGKKTQSPVTAALLVLMAQHPMFGAFISKMILQENSSYIPPVEQHYTFEKLNDRYTKDCLALQKAADIKKKPQEISLSSLMMLHDFHKPQKHNETVIVLDLTKLESGWRMEMLRDQVSFLIQQHRQSAIAPNNTFGSNGHNKTHEVEVLVLLESPGGSASDFALASQHILRLRQEPGICVTCCVDKIAASGGYMIACAANRIFAAPFAIVGSIGVIGQMVNVQKTLEGWGMKPMVFRSGKDKSPVNVIGDVSNRDMKRIQVMVDETHVAFKRHVARARPQLADTIDKLASGKVWLGCDALEVGLVDRIVTSDEYIAKRIGDGALLLKLMKNQRKQFSMFGGSRRNANEPLTRSIASYLLDPVKEYVQNTLITLAKNANLEMDSLRDEPSLSFRAGSGEILARADTAYSFSSP